MIKNDKNTVLVLKTYKNVNGKYVILWQKREILYGF
jgi:hypothetical protein